MLLNITHDHSYNDNTMQLWNNNNCIAELCQVKQYSNGFQEWYLNNTLVHTYGYENNPIVDVYNTSFIVKHWCEWSNNSSNYVEWMNSAGLFRKEITSITDWNKDSIHYDNYKTYISGDIKYYKNHRLHSECGPAVITNGGTYKYYYNGLLHREDGPAVIYSVNNNDLFKGLSGVEWWFNGKRHRDGDNPAAIYSNGIVMYYKQGKLHREGDKPAVYNKHHKEYWLNGKRHRLLGPAIESHMFHKEIWIDGKRITLNSMIKCKLIGNCDSLFI